VEAAAILTAYAWLGLAVSAGLLCAGYWLIGLLGVEVYKRLRRVYHLSVVWYWLDRLEKLGTHRFMRPHPDPSVDPMVAPPPENE
jgi:hypothetical protein